jgi:phage major head subunit gpT-like protein
MEITSARLNAVNKAFNTAFKEGLHGEATSLEGLYLETTSSAETEAYEWLNTIGGLEIFTGEGKFDDLSTSGYEIKNREYQKGVDVPAIAILRDREGVFKPSFQLLGSRANQHKDELIGELLIGGFTQKDYTTKNFFDTDKKHAPNIAGGKAKTPTFSNKGTKKISATNYDTARLSLLARLDRDGRPMRLGKKLKLVVGSASWATARDILTQTKLANGADNPNYNTAELVLMPEIDASTNTYAWFLIDTGMPVKAMIFQNEIPVKLESQTNPESDTVFLNKVFKYQAYASRGAGYGLPQLAFGSTGADAA